MALPLQQAQFFLLRSHQQGHSKKYLVMNRLYKDMLITFILYRNGVFGEYLGIGLGSSILAGSLDASPLPSLIIIFLCGQASEKQGK